jgi:hypothetical protein
VINFTSLLVIVLASKRWPALWEQMTNGMEHALQRLGIDCGRAKVGDRYVPQCCASGYCSAANSGHIFV